MRRRGSYMLETALYLPVLFLLLLGMIELARVTYTYYALQKTLLAIARQVGTQQGVNFCDDTDATIQAAKNFALTGTADGSGSAGINGLAADQIRIRIERYSAQTGEIGECDCSATGCDAGSGAAGPDFIVVSIPEGYSIRLAIPQLPVDPILLRPRVRMPFQGS